MTIHNSQEFHSLRQYLGHGDMEGTRGDMSREPNQEAAERQKQRPKDQVSDAVIDAPIDCGGNFDHATSSISRSTSTSRFTLNRFRKTRAFVPCSPEI